MGVQTMSSLGGGGGGGGGAGGGGAGAGVLSRQGTVYGLTLNEVESHLGEPLRSMNLEDLLRTVLPAASAEPHAPGRGKKTVDEVWRDIESAGGRGRQPTVGEMTLEDFLSRAGVPVDGAGGGGGGACGAGAGAHWLHQYHPPQQYVARPLPRPLGVGAGPVLDAVYHDGGGGGGGGVFLSQVGGGRKRGAAGAAGGGDGVVEKTVERRQKRMIKNRESAARSRARKQAYTNELENKIARLEEEIQLLKDKKLEPVLQFIMPQPETHQQQQQPDHQHQQQLLRQAVLYMPQPEPEPNQHHLRRINSASF